MAFLDRFVYFYCDRLDITENTFLLIVYICFIKIYSNQKYNIRIYDRETCHLIYVWCLSLIRFIGFSKLDSTMSQNTATLLSSSHSGNNIRIDRYPEFYHHQTFETTYFLWMPLNLTRYPGRLSYSITIATHLMTSTPLGEVEQYHS